MRVVNILIPIFKGFMCFKKRIGSGLGTSQLEDHMLYQLQLFMAVRNLSRSCFSASWKTEKVEKLNASFVSTELKFVHTYIPKLSSITRVQFKGIFVTFKFLTSREFIGIQLQNMTYAFKNVHKIKPIK